VKWLIIGATMARPNTSTPPFDWTSASKRIEWLVNQRFDGNRSQFAEAVGCSHSLIFKVIAGQAPGRRLSESIASRLKLNLAWLVAGEGQPGPGPVQGNKIFVANQPLPGSPREFATLLSGEAGADQSIFASTQYWLRLMTGDPLVQQRPYAFRAGDQLLFETDSGHFPRKESLWEHLCVCRISGSGVKLGAVTHYADSEEEGPTHLDCDTFDLGPDPAETIKEVVYQHLPNGVIRTFQRDRKIVKQQGQERLRNFTSLELQPIWPTIKSKDILAVWTGLMRRSPSPV
jgi:hypothetical protein